MMRWPGVVLVGSCVLSACSFGHAIKHATIDRREEKGGSELQMTGGSSTTVLDEPTTAESARDAIAPRPSLSTSTSGNPTPSIAGALKATAPPAPAVLDTSTTARVGVPSPSP